QHQVTETQNFILEVGSHHAVSDGPPRFDPNGTPDSIRLRCLVELGEDLKARRVGGETVIRQVQTPPDQDILFKAATVNRVNDISTHSAECVFVHHFVAAHQ